MHKSELACTSYAEQGVNFANECQFKKWCISNSNIAKIYAHDGEHSNEFKKKVRKGGQNNVHDVATLEFFDAMEHLMKLLEPSKIACRLLSTLKFNVSIYAMVVLIKHEEQKQ